MDYQNYWWNNIPGTNEIIIKIKDGIESGRHVFLVRFADLPWRDAMRNEALSCREEGVVPEYIDAIDEDSDFAITAGRFLLNKYADRESILRFRGSTEKELSAYL